MGEPKRFVQTRVSPDFYAQLEAAAREDRRSIASLIFVVLERHLQERKPPIVLGGRARTRPRHRRGGR